MSTSVNNQFDTIENLIFTEGLRIEALDFHPDQDMMLVIRMSYAGLSKLTRDR
jgi:hypothetical protein